MTQQTTLPNDADARVHTNDNNRTETGETPDVVMASADGDGDGSGGGGGGGGGGGEGDGGGGGRDSGREEENDDGTAREPRRKRPRDECEPDGATAGGEDEEKEVANAEQLPHGRRARRTERKSEQGEDLDAPSNVTDEIAHLSKKSDVLSAEIESLKSCFAQREEQVSRLLSGLGTLGRVERELQQLQTEYQDCSRKDLELIQDALKRVSDCLTQVDRLQRSGNVTSMELQSFRKDCKRQIESLLFKLNEVSDATRVVAAAASEKGMDHFLELRDEISACKIQLSEIEPRRVEVENDFFQRMERFSVQLDHLRLQMSKMEQDLLQENELCRKSLESLVTRQMLQFRQLQKAETKRLQDEMDELRSDMCELLKEMHLLKERTKYLGPDNRYSPQQGVYGQPNRRGTSLARSTLPPDSQQSSYSGYQYGGHDDRYLYDHSQFCHYHHCPAGIPHISRPEEQALSIQSSPRRPSPVTLPPEPRMSTGICIGTN
ncbi:hypothetical protein ATCC90586_009754 [Pythium insidiosum]|nr:hypothetical protein ATCC90586_009754 [Pythium insidiosum]